MGWAGRLFNEYCWQVVDFIFLICNVRSHLQSEIPEFPRGLEELGPLGTLFTRSLRIGRSILAKPV